MLRAPVKLGCPLFFLPKTYENNFNLRRDFFSALAVRAISLNQTDSFGSGLFENRSGAVSDVLTGGPAGASDNYLVVMSRGGGGVNSKHITYNVAQWKGNYLTNGVARLTLQAKNFNGPTLQLRAVLKTGYGPTAGFASTVAFPLPADGAWHRATFDLNETAMTRVNSSSLVFGNVFAKRRLRSARKKCRAARLRAFASWDFARGVWFLNKADKSLSEGGQSYLHCQCSRKNSRGRERFWRNSNCPLVFRLVPLCCDQIAGGFKFVVASSV